MIKNAAPLIAATAHMHRQATTRKMMTMIHTFDDCCIMAPFSRLDSGAIDTGIGLHYTGLEKPLPLRMERKHFASL
jgi:hypothetical protein